MGEREKQGRRRGWERDEGRKRASVDERAMGIVRLTFPAWQRPC